MFFERKPWPGPSHSANQTFNHETRCVIPPPPPLPVAERQWKFLSFFICTCKYVGRYRWVCHGWTQCIFCVYITLLPQILCRFEQFICTNSYYWLLVLNKFAGRRVTPFCLLWFIINHFPPCPSSAILISRQKKPFFRESFHGLFWALSDLSLPVHSLT